MSMLTASIEIDKDQAIAALLSAADIIKSGSDINQQLIQALAAVDAAVLAISAANAASTTKINLSFAAMAQAIRAKHTDRRAEKCRRETLSQPKYRENILQYLEDKGYGDGIGYYQISRGKKYKQYQFSQRAVDLIAANYRVVLDDY